MTVGIGSPSRWGRFTAKGSAEVEARITALVEEAAEALKPLLPPSVCRALILIGGYGRGEGGVISTPDGEHPHNNLDFLAILESNDARKARAIRQQMLDAFLPIARRYDIEIDVGTVSTRTLRWAPSLVMWYDMRFGHKTILGDSGYMPSLRRFEVDRIPPWDARNLLVNRASLLVINDYLLEQYYDQVDRNLVVKHIVKAIIGYGDALLFFLGGYHWSYVERQRRIRQQAGIDEQFRRLYDEAADFRFRPHYADYATRDLVQWMADLRRELGPVHLRCESLRLNCPELDWAAYPHAALRHVVLDDAGSLHGWAKKSLNMARHRSAWALPLPPHERLGAAMLGPANLMRTLFPVVGYDLEIPEFRDLAVRAFDVRDASIAELRRGYLLQWSRYGDVNFQSILRKWQLSL